MAIYRPHVDEDEDSDRKSSRPEAPPPPEGEREHRKHGVAEALCRGYYDDPRLRGYHMVRKACGDFVNHHKIQVFVIFLIVVNALMMGIATFDFVDKNPKTKLAFETTDKVFLAIFTVELGLQFVYMGLYIFRDAWLVFDFFIIVLSWALEELQIIRAFRIFRALRIITRVQTMRNLVTAVFDIMPRLGAITALLCIIFYIFAVLFTSLFGDLELSEPFFTRLDWTAYSLFIFMTMEWAECAREVMDHEGYWWAWIPFVAFVVITGFMVFNLIIAVVCDAVAVIEDKSKLEGDFFEDLANPVHDVSPEIALEEQETVDNLEERISSVLKTQKDMLATLESLTQKALSMRARQNHSPGGGRNST